MDNYFSICNAILVIAELVAAITGIVYFNRLKSNARKFFVGYLVFIFLQEFYFFFNESLFGLSKQLYYGFIGMPIQLIFFYWLISYNSLKKKKLFYSLLFIYLATIPIEYILKENEIIFSLSFTVGILVLSILLIMEFLNQIKSDEILNFRENKMFYVLVGVILGYMATYPFFAFHKELLINHRAIWDVYYVCFICFSTIMYLLFAASFIWGTRQL